MEGIQGLDRMGAWGSNMDCVQKEKTEFIFNEHGTDGLEGTVITGIFIWWVIMLVIIMAGDGNIKCRKVGGVWIPWGIGGHEELGHRWIIKTFVGRWLSCIEI